MTEFKKGDRVVPINDERVHAQVRGRVFVVERVNPKNLRCSAVDSGRGISYPAHLLALATDENIAASEAPILGVPYVHYEVGAIVTLARPYRDWTTETPLVVVGGRDKVNVTLLGGGGDSYLRISRSGLVRRDLEWLKGSES